MTHPVDPFQKLRDLIVDLDELCDARLAGEFDLQHFAHRVDKLAERMMQALPIPSEQMAGSAQRPPTLTCWLD